MENRRFIGRLLSDATVEDAFHPERPRRTIPSTDLPEDSWVQVEVDGSVTSLAAPGSARAQIYALAADKALDPIHPAPVLTEADERFANPQIDAPDLLDLRHLPFVTIDEKTSKDLDQALCIQRAGDGWCVWYAIADAAWFVRPGKPLFEEALRRGATCYMPGLIIPMLPTNLSEDIVSLNPGVDRRALVFRMILAPDGARRGCDILRGRINSKAKLDYDTVDAWLKGDAPPPTDHPEALQSLRYLQTVGQIRIQQAVERDVVRLRRVESAVKLRSDRGLRFVAFADPRNDVERYNEQISLLCNMEGARYLLEDAPDFLQPIFRVHPPPSEARLDSMREMIDAIIGAHRLDRRVWSWDPRGESLATYLDRLPRGGEQGRLARAIHRQAMMSNGRSSFTA
ncbi:MAG: RNB domain-containing ribonuclease, partial [Myxococcota bacterium]